MTSLIGMSKEELTASLAEWECPPWRARQLWRWMYVKGARHFDAMTDIAKPLRQQLAQHYVLARPRVTEKLKSEDGTRKWLIAFETAVRWRRSLFQRVGAARCVCHRRWGAR